jgi:hypothetical protein
MSERNAGIAQQGMQMLTWKTVIGFGLLVGLVLRPATAQLNLQDTVIPPVKTEQGIQASSIDTRTFVPAIDNRPIPLQTPPENPVRKPFPGGEKSNLPVGAVDKLSATVNPGPQFAGMTMNGWYPPDPDIAVGPSHIVEVVNSSFAIFTKTGTKQLEQTFQTLFNGVAVATTLFDPKVIYDRYNDRYVMVVLEKSTSPQISKVLVAVSDDGDPNGTWYRYRLEGKLTVGGVDCWLDYPGFGYNQDGYVISGNMFGFADNTWRTTSSIVLPSAAVLSGGTANTSTFQDNQIVTIQYAKMLGETTSVLYGIGSFNNNFHKMVAIRNITTTPTMVTRLQSVAAWTDPPATAASTSGQTVDGGDGRLYGAIWRNGQLVTSHAVGINSRVAVRWYDIATNGWPTSGTNPSVTQTGNIADSTRDYTYGMITRNAAGEIGLTFSHLSSTNAGSVMVAGRVPTDAAGTVGTPTTLATSAGNNYSLYRWGDYFGIDSDPSDDGLFWVVGMTVATNNQWRTHIESFRLSTTLSIGTVTLNPASVAGGASSTGTVTLTGPAPAGGSVVTLASNNAAATAPATVTVAQGATSATFTITTTAVASAVTPVITGTLGASSKTATLTVNPPALSTLVASAANVIGGKQVRLTANLGSVAPAGGISVALTSTDNTVLPVPATIAIAAGATSGDVLITTGVVSVDTSITATATLGAVSKTAAVTVKAAALSSLVPAKTVVTGGSTVSIRVQLDGAAPTGGTLVTLSSANAAVVSLPLQATVPAGATSVNVDAVSSAVATDTDVAITGTLGSVSKSVTLTVVAPTVSNVSVSPTTVLGGASVTGTVTLTGPAPTGGRVVSLTSNLAAATVPASVTVAAGSTSATFTVSTAAIAANATATLSATNNGVTVTTSLVVRGPAPISVTLSPTSVAGGRTSTATITLEAPAPAGGVVVDLSTSIADASVPASVSIPAGASRVSVVVTTRAVSANVSASIRASLNGVQKSGTLVIAAPVIRTVTFTPSSVTGGLSTPGLVTLQSPAPVGGTVVTLMSANPLVSVPATVTVPANATTALFTASTLVTGVDTSVVVTGTTGALSVVRTLKVLAPRVLSIAFPSSSPVGGTTITGTIKLTGKAPVGGCVVNVTNGLAGIIAPSTVTVDAGLDTATFSVTLPVVAANTVVPWKASLNGAFKTFTMTIKPASMLAVSFSPVSAAGGAPMTGKVTLTGQAPDGGTTVTLVSALPGIAAVPASVVVPAGATNVSFPVTTVPVAADTNVSITATTGATSKVGTARVLAPVVTAFLLSNSMIQGGKTLSGRVNISGTAPAGGVVVTLTSSDVSVAPPVTVIVPEGTKTVGFSIPTSVVTTSTVVTLTAKTGATTKTVVVTINP